MRTLPPDLNVPILLALDESTRLIGIPEQHVTYLFLKGCTALKSLPDILDGSRIFERATFRIFVGATKGATAGQYGRSS